MPIFDFHCKECGTIFEFLIIKTDDIPACPNCTSIDVEKIFNMTPNIRMNSEDILKSLPDPTPPLTELVGKTKSGCEGGFKDLDQTELKDYNRTKDSQGNSIWRPKSRTYFHKGNHSKKSSIETE